MHIIFAFLKAKRVSDAIEMFDEMLGPGGYGYYRGSNVNYRYFM